MPMAATAGLAAALAKLERRSAFSHAARLAFLEFSGHTRSYPAQQDIVCEGDATDRCRFLHSGTVSRSKLLPNGGRQIASFHIAGDLIDLPSALLLVADHTLRTHEPSVVFDVSGSAILKLAEDFSEIGRAFWFDTLVEASIFREWSLNLGRRNAREKTAHLLMEMGYRVEEARLGSKTRFDFPVTQQDLSDALGLTPVHVNRSLKWLRDQGYVEVARKRVVIHDWQVLAAFCAFRPLYLHPEGPRAPPP
jgi:CRP-like cAMP-binding protein